jgi:hypothetical protein
MKVAVVPSNQFANHTPVAGVTEETIWVIAAKEAIAEFGRQGVEAKLFYIPGSTGGSSTGSVDELIKMCDQMMTWLNTLPASERYAFSMHSNTGSGTQYLYPLIGLPNDVAWATTYGKNAAARLQFTFRAPTYRTDLTYFSHSKVLGPSRTLLSETGEHQTAVDAAYLYKYARFDGIMLVRAYLQACGKTLVSDGPVPSDVVVPAGAAFDKYRPGVIGPPTPPPPVVTPTLPTLTASAVPFMRDGLVVGTPTTWDIQKYPIHWLQNALKVHSYKSGTSFTDRNGGAHDIKDLVIDGVYGLVTEGAVKHFQAEHYALNGVHLEVNGIVDQNDWDKLRTV